MNKTNLLKERLIEKTLPFYEYRKYIETQLNESLKEKLDKHNCKIQLNSDIGETLVPLKTCFEVLDEAKRDFVKLLHEDDALYWLHNVGQIELDFKQKFKKWFGDDD